MCYHSGIHISTNEIYIYIFKQKINMRLEIKMKYLHSAVVRIVLAADHGPGPFLVNALTKTV